MEKVEIEELGFFDYEELFDKFLILALILLLIEILLFREKPPQDFYLSRPILPVEESPRCFLWDAKARP